MANNERIAFCHIDIPYSILEVPNFLFFVKFTQRLFSGARVYVCEIDTPSSCQNIKNCSRNMDINKPRRRQYLKTMTEVASSTPSANSYLFDRLVSNVVSHLKPDIESIIREVCTVLNQPNQSDFVISQLVNSNFVAKLKQKKVREGPAPSLSAYLLFTREKRPIIKSENPDLKTEEIMVTLGKMWQNLDEVGRQPYHALAANDKERYLDELEKFKNRKSGNIGLTNAPTSAASAAGAKKEKKGRTAATTSTK